MKKSIVLVMALTVAMLGNAATVTVPASSNEIQFVGRTLVQDSSVSFDWTATYARISFSGTTLSMRVSDTHKNFYNVWVDCPTSDEPLRVVTTFGQDSVVNLVLPEDVKASKRKVHDVVIQKRTEGEQGKTTIHSFTCNGKFYPALGLKNRQLEFVGDSYTCGYGSENSVRNDPFKPETENAAKTFPAILARYFDADYIAVAHSGMGIARNYNTKFAGWYMADRYMQTFDMDSTAATRWKAENSNFHPAMTVVYLGANDFSVSMQPKYEVFRNKYFQLLHEIKANYGEEHPILCITSKHHEYLFTYVRAMVHECGLKNVNYLGCCPALHHENNTDLGASAHPNYNGHQKIAYSVIPHVATMTGWELQDRPIK